VSYVWIPFVVLGAVLVVFLILLLLARIQGGRFLRPVVTSLSKIPFMKRFFERMSVAALERSNPELASAVKKMRTFGEPKTPEQVQRALAVLTPAERKAYMQAVGEQAPSIDATNRQQRRRIEQGKTAGVPVQRPGAAGRRPKKRR
jgi:hypothetical protein